MSAQDVELGFAGLKIAHGSHIAYSYRDEAKRQDLLLHFILAGLAAKEKCIIAACEYPNGFWREGLRKLGMLYYDNQFTVLSPSRLFPASKSDTLNNAVKVLKHEVEKAFYDGWQSVRICSSFNHLYHRKEIFAQALQAEKNWNDFTINKPITKLCNFDAARLHPNILNELVSLHPLSTDGYSLKESVEEESSEYYVQDTIRRLSDTRVFTKPTAELDFVGDIPVVRVLDEVDLCTAPDVKAIADFLIVCRHRSFVIDLSGSGYLDVSAVRVLLEVSKSLRERDGLVVICDPMDPPRKLFTLTGLGENIPIRRTIRDAEHAIEYSS